MELLVSEEGARHHGYSIRSLITEKLTALIRNEQDMVEPEKSALDCLKRLRQLEQEDRLTELQRELKRTDLGEGERAALLKQIADMIRAKK